MLTKSLLVRLLSIKLLDRPVKYDMESLFLILLNRPTEKQGNFACMVSFSVAVTLGVWDVHRTSSASRDARYRHDNCSLKPWFHVKIVLL